MKVAVIGSRCVDDYELVKEELNKIKGITEIVSGGARGADTLAKLYADDHNIPIEVFLPDWSIGKMAGMLRNTQIVDYCDVAVVFWDGVSKGTADSIRKLKAQGKKTKIIIVQENMLTFD